MSRSWNVAIGWLLAALLIAVAFWRWGWPGVVLGLTIVVFGLLLQFSRALRVLRQAGQAPVGHTDNAVMLHARLQKGQKLVQILALTRSLGQAVPLSDGPQASQESGVGGSPKAATTPASAQECWRWTDSAGDAVSVTLNHGRVSHWALERGPQAVTKVH